MMKSCFRVVLGIALLLFGSSAVTAQQKDAAATFEKVMSAPAGNDYNFSDAANAVSNEHKSLITRNPERRRDRLLLFSLTGKKPNRTRLPDSTSFGFIPNSTKIWIFSCFGTVQFWDSRTHKKLDAVFPHAVQSECSAPDPAISPDGSVMATQTDDSLQLWDLRTLKPLSTQQGHEWGYGLDFSSDGMWLFTRRRTVKIRDPKTGKLLAGPFRDDLIWEGFAYFPRKHQLATIENNSKKEEAWKSVAVIRSGMDWSDVRRVEMVGHAREATWIDENHLLVVADNKRPGQKGPFSRGRKLVYVVSLAKDKPEIQTILRDVWIPRAAVAPDGKHIVATTPGTTSCWKLGDTEPLWTKPANYGVSLSSEGWVLLRRDGSASVCSLATGKELWRKDEIVTSRVDGSHVWLCRDKGIEVWRFQK